MKKTFLRLFAGLLMFGCTLSAQNLEQALDQLAGDAAKAYLNPVSQSFLTNFNGGLFHNAPSAKLFGFNIEIGAALMSTPFADDQKTINATGKFTFNKAQADRMADQISSNPLERPLISQYLQENQSDIKITGPSIIGKSYVASDPTSEVAIEMASNITVNGIPYSSAGERIGTGFGGVQEIADLKTTLFFTPQITLGTIVGTQLTFRYLPKIPLKGYGKISMSGFGIQHNFGYWFPIPVVDVAASFYSQKLKIDPMFEMSGTSFGLNVSKQFGMSFLNVTPYAGFMIESSKFKVNYTPPDGAYGTGITPPTVNFEIEGENTSRLVLGLGIRLLAININADYNIGKYNSFTAGAFFAF